MRDHVIDRLFSLFTSADRAEAMAGDLIQERPIRGSRWFWYHVFTIAATLWGTTLARAPVRTVLVFAAGCAFIAGSMFAGMAAVNLFPRLLGDVVAWSLLAIFWWGGAHWTGSSMIAIAPAHGMPACVMLAVIGEAALLAAWAAGMPVDAEYVVTAAAAAWPLLVGAAAARGRVIAWTHNSI